MVLDHLSTILLQGDPLRHSLLLMLQLLFIVLGLAQLARKLLLHSVLTLGSLMAKDIVATAITLQLGIGKFLVQNDAASLG